MADNGKDEALAYSSLRVRTGTNCKLRVLSGLMEIPIIDVLDQLVDEAYHNSIRQAADAMDTAASEK